MIFGGGEEIERVVVRPEAVGEVFVGVKRRAACVTGGCDHALSVAEDAGRRELGRVMPSRVTVGTTAGKVARVVGQVGVIEHGLVDSVNAVVKARAVVHRL